jgi:bZIP transcription factor
MVDGMDTAMQDMSDHNNNNHLTDENDDMDDDDNGDGPPESEEVKARKRKERLEQNRISARESRKRKKCMIEELQRTVITLSRENKDLNERNETLRRQLMELASKVRRGKWPWLVVLLLKSPSSNIYFVCFFFGAW